MAISGDQIKAVLGHPRFAELTAIRSAVRWWFSTLTVLSFFGFVLMISFARPTLAMKVGGGLMPLGFYLTFGMGLFVVGLTGVYVYVANRLFGRLTDSLVKELKL
jgi:uncharacterized membrane protein (DUF485 family)